MKAVKFLSIVLIIIFMFTSCLPGPNTVEKEPNEEGEIAGFWLGLWHGLLAPFTFIISLFTPNVRFYEVHNSGGWYNFGFVLGAGLFLSGGILGHRKSRKHR
ncbi:MAG: hypothetical protein ACOC6P_03330 [Candidatus Aminicenantaceae bacterium]